MLATMPTRSRYGTRYEGMDWSGLGPSPEPQPDKKDDPLADFLRLAGTALPAVGGIAGTAIGAGVGGLPGAMIGGSIGSAAGQAAGTAAGMGADYMERDEREAEDKRFERERERQARQQAALSLLGQAR